MLNGDAASFPVPSDSAPLTPNPEHQHVPPAIILLSVLGAFGNTIFLGFRFPILLVLMALSILTANISFFVFIMGGFMFATYAWALYALLTSRPISLNALLLNGWRIYWASITTIFLWLVIVFALLFASIPLIRWTSGLELFDFNLNVPLPYESFVWLLLLFVVAAEVTTDNLGFFAWLKAPFYLVKKYWLCSLLFLLLTFFIPVMVAYPSLVGYLDSTPTWNDWRQGVPEVHWLLRRQTLNSLSSHNQFIAWCWIFAIFTTIGAVVQLAAQAEQNGTKVTSSSHLNRVNTRPWSMAALFLAVGSVVGSIFLYQSNAEGHLIPTKQLMEFGNRYAMSLHYASEETILTADSRTVCRLNTIGWFNRCERLWHVADEESFMIAVKSSPASQQFMTVTEDRSGEWGHSANILRVHSAVDGQILHELAIPWMVRYKMGAQEKSIAFDRAAEHLAVVTKRSAGNAVAVGAIGEWASHEIVDFGVQINRAVLSPDGKYLAVLTEEENIWLIQWQVADAVERIFLPNGNGLGQNGIDNANMAEGDSIQKIQDIAFGQDGNSLIVLTKTTLMLLDAATHELLYTLSFDEEYDELKLDRLRLASDPGYAIVIGGGTPVNFSPTGGIQMNVFGVNRSFAHIVRLDDGELLDSIPASIVDVDFLPSRGYLALSGREPVVTRGIWGTSYSGDNSVGLYRVDGGQ